MPFFEVLSIDVLANTAKEDAIEDKLELRGGSVITRAILHVPDGVDGLAPVWVERNESQILPTNPGDEIALGDTPDLEIVGRAEFLPVDTTSTIAFKGYNNDSEFNHEQKLLLRGLHPTEVPDGGIDALRNMPETLLAGGGF